MTKKLGFIGAGNLAEAIIVGTNSPADIIISDANADRLAFMAEKYGIEATPSNTAVAQQSELLFLSIKPHIYPTVIAEIRDTIPPDTIVIILAAGLSIAAVQKLFANPAVKLVKAMPNTPSMVKQGITAVCKAENVTFDDLVKSCQALENIGLVEILPEALFDAFTATASSSPAYVYTFIEALADAAVKNGIPREQALRIASQAVLGSAQMVLQTATHPAALRDAVCSPGGTTIEAVCTLEAHGFRHAVIAAADAVVAKYNELAK